MHIAKSPPLVDKSKTRLYHDKELPEIRNPPRSGCRPEERCRDTPHALLYSSSPSGYPDDVTRRPDAGRATNPNFRGDNQTAVTVALEDLPASPKSALSAQVHINEVGPASRLSTRGANNGIMDVTAK